VSITGTVPTRLGHKFLGWSTDKKATTATYKAGDKLTLSDNTTLYAVWEVEDSIFGINIYDGTSFSKYLTYIHDGEKFSAYTVYVHNGTSWEEYL
jgi:uncharacterized repeat protein (TIGR02543 family)